MCGAPCHEGELLPFSENGIFRASESLEIITVCVVCPQADSQVEIMRKHFQEESLDYVCKLQEIQERKKFECVEPVSHAVVLDPFCHIKIVSDTQLCV